MIDQIYIEKWSEMSRWADGCFFHRGQHDASWSLETSFRRSFLGTDNEEYPLNREFWCLREFKRRAHVYLKQVPSDGDIIAWLSLMQHHGIPTRLLDFSHSFYVAAYFAIRGSIGDSAVWSISYAPLISISQKIFKLKIQGLRDEWDDSIYAKANGFLGKKFKSSGPENATCLKGVSYVEPFLVHQRLGAQQGLFLIPMDINIPFIENLRPHVKGQPLVRKLTFNKKIRDEAMHQFEEMNITEETLFPGIDGLARSIADKVLY